MKPLIGDYQAFVAKIDAALIALRIKPSELAMLDHICYRVETDDRYRELLSRLQQASRLLGETVVNGRLIASFEAEPYLRAGRWTIPYIELPAPKAGTDYREGLEHVEFVIIGGLDRFEARHSDLMFDQGGMNKPLNPALGLKVGNISIKFHEQSLGAVVRSERWLTEAVVRIPLTLS